MHTPEPSAVNLFESPTPAPAPCEVDPAVAPQDLADDIGAGLSQLGWVLRRHAELAPAMRWELSGLPALVLDPAVRAAIVATAVQVGATAAPARYSGPDFHGTVLSFGETGSVRLLISIPRQPDDAANETANLDHALIGQPLVRAFHDEPSAKHAAATAGAGLVDLDPPPAEPVDSATVVIPVVRLQVADRGRAAGEDVR